MPPTIVSRFPDPCVSQITPHNAFRAKPDSAINHPLDVYTQRLFKQHRNKNADNGNKKWCQHKTWPAFRQDENVVRIKNMKKNNYKVGQGSLFSDSVSATLHSGPLLICTDPFVQVTAIVADALAPIWHQDVRNRRADFAVTVVTHESCDAIKTSKESGPRPNIKTVFPRYENSYVRDMTVARPSYL